MTSIEEFYFRYYANRLLREGYIDQREYQALLTTNQLDYDLKEKHKNAKPFQFFRRCPCYQISYRCTD